MGGRGVFSTGLSTMGTREVKCSARDPVEGLVVAREGPMTEERILGCLLRPQGQALLTSYSSTALRLLKEKLLREAPHTQGESIKLTVIVQTTRCRITFCFCNNLSFFFYES